MPYSRRAMISIRPSKVIESYSQPAFRNDFWHQRVRYLWVRASGLSHRLIGSSFCLAFEPARAPLTLKANPKLVPSKTKTHTIRRWDRLYEEFKEAPGLCQTFAQELLLFHNVLMGVNMTVKSEDSHLDYSDQAALSTCLDSCKELLCKTILGLQEVPVNLWNLDIGLRYAITNIFECKGHGDAGPFNTLRQRFEKRKLALQIPKLQRAISVHIEKLNTFLALYVFTIYEVGFAADLPIF